MLQKSKKEYLLLAFCCMNDTQCNFSPLLLQSLKTDRHSFSIVFCDSTVTQTTIQSIRRQVSAYSQPSSGLISSRTQVEKNLATGTRSHPFTKIIIQY
jgi:hypothetical protein